MKLFSKMKKIPRIILKTTMWLTISVVFIVIVLLIWLSLFFPSETVRKLIESEGSKQLGRVVKVEGLNVSLWTGIRIKNFSISDAGTENRNIALPGGSIFVRAGEVDLSYRLLPILWKKLDIKHAVIRKPEIHVVKYKNGSFNFSDIINRMTAPPSPGQKLGRENAQTTFDFKKLLQNIIKTKNTSMPIFAALPPAATPAASKTESSPMEFDISKVGFENAVITYTDYSLPGMPAKFTIDRFNLIVSDIDSKNYRKPAKLTLTFQVSTKRLENNQEQPKLFNLYTQISGSIYLFNKEGKMLNTPAIYLKVDFKNGLISGSEIQKALNNVLEDLKKKFFNNYAGQVLNIVQNFDKIAKEKLTEYVQKYTGRIDELVSKLKGSRDKSTGDMQNDKTGALANYKKKITDAVAVVDNANKKFQDTMQGIYRAYSLINPREAAKMKTEMDNRFSAMNNESAKIKARMNGSSGGMNNEFDAVIAKVKKQYDDAIAKIHKTFEKMLEKYVKGIQSFVADKLKNIIKKIQDFKLNLPFLSKNLEFEYGNLLLSYVNGVATIERLYIGSPKFKVKAEKISYNTHNSAVDARIDFYADKKYNTNVFTNFFAEEGQDVQIPVKVTGTTSKPDVKLVGMNLTERFKNFAVKYAKILAKQYFGADLPIEKIFGSTTPGGGDYKAQFKAIAQKFLQKLIDDQRIQEKLRDKLVNEFKAKAAPGGGSAPVRNIRNRLRF